MRPKKLLLLICLLVLGILLRLPGIFFGLPQVIDPDDNYVINPAINLALDIKQSPKKFGLPDSTLFYTQALTIKIAYPIVKKLGITSSVNLLEVYENKEPWLYALARTWNLLYALLILCFTFILTKKFFPNSSTFTTLFACLVLIFNPLLIEHATYIRPDIPLTAFMLLTIF